MRSIRWTILLITGVLIFVLALAISLYAGITQRNSAIEAAKLEAQAMAESHAAAINAELEVAMDTARTLAQSLEGIKDSGLQINRAAVDTMLIRVLQENPSFLGTYTAWEPNTFDGLDEQYVNQPGSDASGRYIPYWVRSGGKIIVEPLIDYEVEGAGDYYQIPKKTGKEALIDPYWYEIDGKQVLLCSMVVPLHINMIAPVKAENQFAGITGVDIGLDFLQQQTDNFNEFNGKAKMIIFSNNGTIAGMTGKPELVGKSIDAVHADWQEDLEYIQKGETITQEDEGNIMVLVPIRVGQTTTPWAVNVLIPMDEITRPANASMLRMFLISAVLMLVALGVIWFFSGQIANPIKTIAWGARLLSQGDANVTGIDRKVIQRINSRKDELGDTGKAFSALIAYFNEMANQANAIADGDLRASVKPKGETDLLGNAFVRMVAGLRNAITNVQSNAAQVNQASEQLASAANQAGQATTQISTTIQQVARGTSQQSESVNATAASVEQMSRAIQGVAKGAQEQAAAVANASTITAQLSTLIAQVAGNAEAVLNQASSAADAARSGAKTVEATLNGMRSIQNKVGLSAAKVQEMGSRSEQVGVILTTIEDIASQTNLLALNAAIEAARAGEAGKGFAVVADEVRKLAERSANATREIGDLIKAIQHSVADAVSAMNDGAKEVENGVSLAGSSGQALSAILQAAEAVNQQARQAAEASKRMADSANQLVSSVDSVSAVVEENTAATEEMAASSSEVTRAIENIASISEENSAAVEEVSASTEEMAAQVEEVTASASALADLARSLQQVVNQFRLS